eukprot:Gb_41033 [translate_table: standard]
MPERAVTGECRVFEHRCRFPAIAIDLPCVSTEACRVGGYHIPPGTRLLVNVWAIHRDPTVWEKPLEFQPERFISEPTGQDFEFIPFGSGRRACAGLSLGLSIVQLSLARLLQSFDWSAPNGNTALDMTENFRVAFLKAAPLEAVIKPRLPNHLY